MSFTNELQKFSDPAKAQIKAYKYLGSSAIIYESNRKNKKYKIFNPNTEKWIHFGQLGYLDYTKHADDNKKKNYLARSTKINGNWKENKYSPNNLSIHILW
jgi:hypothetical protein